MFETRHVYAWQGTRFQTTYFIVTSPCLSEWNPLICTYVSVFLNIVPESVSVCVCVSENTLDTYLHGYTHTYMHPCMHIYIYTGGKCVHL